MKTIYLVRHGRTLFNQLYRMQGGSDTQLLPEGRQKAVALGQAFKKEQIKFDAAFSSDLGRARETARLILANCATPDLSLTELEALREVNFGSFEGTPSVSAWDQARVRSGIHNLTAASPDNIRIQALHAFKEMDSVGLAESYEDVVKRIEQTLTNLSHSEGQTILAVSHGLFINCIIYYLQGKETPLEILPNTSVTKLLYEKETDSYRILYVGREAHFAD
ncbi:MAG: histidine phosphatase family protein [Sporolactobacillus sp.]